MGRSTRFDFRLLEILDRFVNGAPLPVGSWQQCQCSTQLRSALLSRSIVYRSLPPPLLRIPRRCWRASENGDCMGGRKDTYVCSSQSVRFGSDSTHLMLNYFLIVEPMIVHILRTTVGAELNAGVHVVA